MMFNNSQHGTDIYWHDLYTTQMSFLSVNKIVQLINAITALCLIDAGIFLLLSGTLQHVIRKTKQMSGVMLLRKTRS